MNQFKSFFKELFTEAETFQAKSKETGKLVNFKSKASMDAALKAGSHENPNAPKGGKTGGKDSKKDVPKVNIFDKPSKSDEPTSEPSQPKQQRKGNPEVNKATKSLAEKEGFTPQNLGKEEYKTKMMQAAVSALSDANFHQEARELVAKLEGKPEWAKAPQYPSMDDPEFDEKMKAIRTNSSEASKYMQPDGNTWAFGREIAQESQWDGVDAADGIAFTLRMNGFHKEADAIQSIFDDKPYMKESGPLKLGKLVKESKRIKLIKEDTRRVKLLGIDFKVSEMNGRIFFSFVDKKAATIQLRQVGTNKIVNHIQNRLDIAFGKGEFFFKSGDHAEFQNGYLFQRNTSDINLNKIKFESVNESKLTAAQLPFKFLFNYPSGGTSRPSNFEDWYRDGMQLKSGKAIERFSPEDDKKLRSLIRTWWDEVDDTSIEDFNLGRDNKYIKKVKKDILDFLIQKSKVIKEP